MTAWVPVMSHDFFKEKNHKIANNSTTTKGIEKNNHRLRNLRILEIFGVCLTKFRNNKILLNEISHISHITD